MSVRRLFGPKDRPLILGHRGVPSAAQENTLDAVLAARDLGIDGVEVDVFVTLDQHVICFHDEETERLCGIAGRIDEMTLAQVSTLRVQRHLDPGDGVVRDFGVARPVPTLAEVLDATEGMLVNVELKPSTPSFKQRHVGTRVAELIVQKGAADRVIVTGFDLFKLRALEKEAPNLLSGFAYDDAFADYLPAWIDRLPELSDTFGDTRTSWVNALAESNTIGKWARSSVVGIERTLVDEDTVARFHQKDMAVGVYTLYPLDQRAVKGGPQSAEAQDAEALRLAAMGVDWIETDDPARLLALLS